MALLELTAPAISNARVTLFLVAVVILGGVFTFQTMPSQEDPEVTIRVAQVTVGFPGMAPQRVEELLIEPIEEVVKELPELKEVRSTARTGSAIIEVEIQPQYFDLPPIWSDLRNKIDDLKPDLPDGTQGPYVNDDFGRVSVTTLALTAPEFTPSEIRATARYLRRRISALPLVSTVDLYGLQPERIWLEITPERREQLGRTGEAMLQALVGQNVILPSGTLPAHGLAYTIEASGSFESVEEIASLAVDGPDGVIYLKDFLTVERGVADPPERPVLFNGEPAVVIAASMVPGVAIARFGREIEALVEEVRGDLALGMQLEYATHQPPLVEAAVGGAVENLSQTLATVLVVVMLILGWRTGLIVGAIVPLSILASIVLMRLWEVPLHRISIAAIIVALGLLVDNGIVVAEDIQRRLAEGTDRLAAAIGAGNALGGPLLTATLTTVLAFMPLMLAEDTAGEYTMALSQVVMTTLLSSWLLSITVTPALCYWFLPSPDEAAPADAGASDRGTIFQRLYRPFLAVSVGRPAMTAAAMLGAVILGFVLLGFVTQRLMPNSDRAQLVLYMDLPAGADARETARVADRLASWISDETQNPEVQSNVIYVSSGGPRFFLALQPVDPDSHVVFGVVNVESNEQVDPLIARLAEFAADHLPEARFSAEKLFLGSTAPGTVEIRTLGPDIETLQRLQAEVAAVFRSVPGTINIKNDWENPVVKVTVNIDQERARLAGVSTEEVSRTLAAYFDGYPISDYREGDAVIPIMYRAQEPYRNDVDDLRSMTIWSQARAERVPLSQVADFDGELEPSRIKRFDQQRGVTTEGIHPDLQATELYATLLPGLDAIDLPPGYRLVVEGELRASAEANGALFAYLPHCLAGIVFLLILQFNSFRRPAIVFLTIPLVVLGGAIGLLMLDALLDFVATLGFLSLAGVIINNGIVLIDTVDQLRGEGASVVEAVRRAALKRVRPILMTTLTTVLGLIPLLLFGGEFWFGMATVMIFGLGFGTLLSLLLVPALYVVFFQGDEEPAG